MSAVCRRLAQTLRQTGETIVYYYNNNLGDISDSIDIEEGQDSEGICVATLKLINYQLIK